MLKMSSYQLKMRLLRLGLLQMISNGVRDLTKRFEDDRILQHDHRVPVLREDAVLEKVAEHAEHLHHEVDL
jgi:hypothetical protein